MLASEPVLHHIPPLRPLGLLLSREGLQQRLDRLTQLPRLLLAQREADRRLSDVEGQRLSCMNHQQPTNTWSFWMLSSRGCIQYDRRQIWDSCMRRHRPPNVSPAAAAATDRCTLRGLCDLLLGNFFGSHVCGRAVLWHPTRLARSDCMVLYCCHGLLKLSLASLDGKADSPVVDRADLLTDAVNETRRVLRSAPGQTQ